MKHKNIYSYGCLVLLASVMLFSCKKKDPSVDDYFLNYTIPDVAPTANYTVGAFYYTSTSWNAAIKYTPTAVGAGGTAAYLSTAAGVVPSALMQAHINAASAAKIDYFVFSVRSPNLNNNGYKVDSTIVNSFLTAPNSSKMNFVISYNMETSNNGITNTGNNDANGNPRGTPLEANAAKLESFYKDFQRLAYFLGKSNYQKINGKWLLIFNHAQDLNSNMDPNNPGSTAPVYAEIRKRLSALGFDLYIIGEQDNWSSPDNYYYRYQNAVDAVYEANMSDYRAQGLLDRRYLFGPVCDQNFAYWKKELELWPAGGLTPGQKKLEFVPCIEAGYNYQINTPTNAFVSITRDATGSFYRTFTNIAKRNASASNLVLIDSFNNFQVDTQIEPTNEYGTLYMDITKQEFKLN
jgi:hypothetical protein